MTITLTWEDFVREFSPIPVDHYGTLMLNSFSEDDVKLVKAQPDRNVWTVVSIDFGTMVIEGFHEDNAIGYYITRQPWFGEATYEVDKQQDLACDCGLDTACEICKGTGEIELG